jgi:DNA invertase Pin-like site-specific DNA recombinase
MANRSKNLPKKGSRVSRVEAERFVTLYNQLGTYKAVADITGRSADTVSRWVKILQAESMVIFS